MLCADRASRCLPGSLGHAVDIYHGYTSGMMLSETAVQTLISDANSGSCLRPAACQAAPRYACRVLVLQQASYSALPHAEKIPGSKAHEAGS